MCRQHTSAQAVVLDAAALFVYFFANIRL